MVAELQIDSRTEKGSRQVRRLRATGKIPAVLYGEGKPATMLSVDERKFVKLVYSGERVLVLKGSEGPDRQALIKDIQFDSLGEQMLHVDFHELKAGQKVTVKIAISLKGTAKGQAEGGNVNQVLHETEIECLPVSIPEKLFVDVSDLEIGQSVKVQNIEVPEGVSMLAKPETVVAICEEPRKAVEEETVEAAEGTESAEPEVLTEKKDEEKGEDKKDKKDEKK